LTGQCPPAAYRIWCIPMSHYNHFLRTVKSLISFDLAATLLLAATVNFKPKNSYIFRLRAAVRFIALRLLNILNT
jgi:hypothetical protein